MPDENTPKPGEQSPSGSGGQETGRQQQSGGEQPPWGDNFDPQRAWNTITNLRTKEEELKATKSELQKLKDQELSESQRVAAERDREKVRADEAELRSSRIEVASELGLPVKYASRLVGSTRAELEEDAKKLIEDFGIEANDGSTRRQTRDFDGGVRRSGPKDETMSDMIRRVAGRG